MIKRSPELEAITTRFLHALTQSNGEMMQNLLHSSAPLVFCGSADNEVFRDDFYRTHYARHISEMPTGIFRDTTVEGYEGGELGWCFFTGTYQIPSTGKEAIARVSIVYALDNGIWKVQHMHNSFPTPNLDAMGYEHPALDDLLDAAASADPQVGQSGIAAVMFTDIAESSALAEIVGDAAWAARVRQHMDTLKGHIEDAEGQLIKTLGDGTMSTFKSARTAMQAARSIQRTLAKDHVEPHLAVRIGIHTGDVVQAGDDFFGTVVNKAARVAGVAAGGEIRVSDATKIMVGGASEFVFEDLVRIPLKGLDGEHVVYRLRTD